MKKLISLLKATMSQDMSLFKIKSNNKYKINKKIFPIILALFVMFSMGSYVELMAETLAPHHLTYIILTMFIIIISILTIIEGIYKSQGILFEAKDNNILFSLPISKSKILFSRLFKLISFQFLYNLLFMVPVIIVYAIHEPTNISFYISSFVMLLMLPIIPTIIGSIIGYLIKLVSSKVKAKTFIQVLLSSIMLIFLMYISFNMENIMTKITQNANNINNVLTKIYYPAGLYLNLIKNFNILDLFKLIIINIVPAILFIYIASIFYFKIISKLGEKSNNKIKSNLKNISNKKFNVKSQLSALIYKELKRFFTSPVFIINTGFGLIILLLITISLSINCDGLLNSFITENTENTEVLINEIKIMLPQIFYFCIIFTSCLTCITSSMISLEGKSFNITKSLPISTKKILLSKILTSNIISIPIILLSDIIFFISFKVSILDILIILLTSIIMPTFTAIIGLLINLKYPKLNATSDTEIVKQSLSSMISVFIGMVIGIISIIITILGAKYININLVILLELMMFTIITLVLWKILKVYGVKQFKKINI